MHERWRPDRIFLYRAPVDMRKSIDGLSTLIHEQLERDPTDRSLYVFINRSRDKVKMLLWERNGFWLLYKRLEKQRFSWPHSFDGDSMAMAPEQLGQLLDGINLNALQPHRELRLGRVA